MKLQPTFADLQELAKTKRTKKAQFLDDMNKLVPWRRFVRLLEPFYPRGTRRPTVGLERMLRIYFIQQWFGLADEATEDAVIETPILRQFVGIDLMRESVPDETTILNFRRMIEKNHLAKKINAEVNAHLAEKCLVFRKGTIIDATIIQAPSSTKNEEGKRDEEMASTRKGNNYHFGMKAHIGVDSATGVVHSVAVTPANVGDVTVADQCLHGEEEHVVGDAGYVGIEKREEHQGRTVEWFICARRSKVREGWKKFETMKASIRAKVEHMFQIIKCRFGYRMARYKGLAKNESQINVLFALANIVKVRKYLLQMQERTA